MQWSNYPSYLYHSTPRFCLQWDFTRYLRWVTVSSFKMGQGVFELNIWGNGQSDMLLAIYEHAVRPTHPKHFLWWVMGSGERCVVVVLRVSTAIVLLLVVQSWSVALVVCQWHGTSTIQIQICIFFTGKERFHVSLCSLFITYLYICRNIRSQWYIYVSPSLVFSIWSQSPSSHHVEVLSVAFDVDYITRVSVFGIDRLILQLTVPWGCWQIGVFFLRIQRRDKLLMSTGRI